MSSNWFWGSVPWNTASCVSSSANMHPVTGSLHHIVSQVTSPSTIKNITKNANTILTNTPQVNWFSVMRRFTQQFWCAIPASLHIFRHGWGVIIKSSTHTKHTHTYIYIIYPLVSSRSTHTCMHAYTQSDINMHYASHLAKPKSHTDKSQLPFTSKLEGFRSRCNTFAEWMYFNPRKI